ncbi:MAG: TetR/AcrR family transcriptional regulator [Cyanobacteria bacterium P01_D01_bin.36]
MSPAAQPTENSSPSGSKNNPEKADVILAGALEVFSERGYAAASMEKIAKAASVSKPTLYKYFQDKEGLFLALVRQLTNKNQARLPMLLAHSGEDIRPQKVLKKIATMVINDFPRDEAILKLMRLIIGESERFPHLAQTFVREIEKPMFEKFAAYFAQQTQLQLSDPMVTARVFTGSIVHYLIIQKVLYGDEVMPLDCDRMVDGLVELITAKDKTFSP